MIVLMRPDPSWATQVREALAEMEDGHVPGSMTSESERAAILAGDEDAFRVWVATTLAEEDAVTQPGWVTHSSYWIADDDRLLGFIDVRHELTDALLRYGGHIGYAVRPSERGKGVASQALRLALAQCAERGIGQALLTCDESNLGSQRVIESAGGALENIEGTTRRYWVATRPSTRPSTQPTH